MDADVAGAAMPIRVARYQLLIPIGTGGMGTVYLGHFEVMPGVPRDVAVKLMHPQLRSEDGLSEQLLQEAKIAASIRHPNVVQVLEAGDSPHGVYLAMDYVEGDNLSGLLRATLKRGDHMPFRIAARILHDALTGLHAAHELSDREGRPLQVVHRDFSPQNILVGVDGISRLTDFGIAKALDQLNATATGIVKGKVGYMSPEQARGEPLDRRSDVWAAGVVAWEVLAGKRLYREANEAATLLSVVSGKPPPTITSLRSEASTALNEAVRAALVADKTQRLSTAHALREALTSAFAAHGGMAEREEVANFVAAAVGDRIDKRKVQADDVSRLRHAIADVSEAAGRDAQDSVASSMGGKGPPPSEDDATKVMVDRDEPFGEVSTRAALSAERQSVRAPDGRPKWVFVAGATLAIAIGGVAAWRMLAAGASVAEPTQSAPVPPAASAATTSSPTPAAVLRISANSPVAQLKLGDRNIVLPDPATKAEVPLGDGEATMLVAIAADGRRAEVPLAEGQRAVAVVFQAAPAASATSSAAPPRPIPRPGPKDDGLADSPYGN
jgi:eukaryotic-like serine/threonine-protein kinase